MSGINSLVFGAILAVAIVVVWKRTSKGGAARSLRAGMIVAWLFALGFAVDALAWIVVRPLQSGESGAIPVDIATAADVPETANLASWQSLQIVNHTPGGGTLMVDYLQPRTFLAFGFSPTTEVALIALNAIGAAMGAYLSWLVYRVCRNTLDGASFTATLVRQVNRASFVVAVAAVVREIARWVATSGLYAEIRPGAVAIESVARVDGTWLLVALGLAAFGQLLRVGLRATREVEGLV